MGFFPHSPFSMESSFPPHDNRFFLGGSVMNGESFSESLRTSNAIELLQREQEKERIREEIIAAERVRIQTLEAEVRKELATERELRLQQAKPTPTLAMIKGKVVAVGGSGFPHKELTCDLCQVTVKSELDLRSHMLGKKHKEKLDAAPKSDEVVASMGTSNNSKVATLGGAGILINSKKVAYKEWTCHLCNVSMTCDQAVIAHINGKKHQARRQHRNQMKLQGHLAVQNLQKVSD